MEYTCKTKTETKTTTWKIISKQEWRKLLDGVYDRFQGL